MAIEQVSAGFGFCTAGLRPAFLNLVLKLRLQIQNQRRRPEASGTKDGAIAAVDDSAAELLAS
ncbi:MAG: hypothetical protein WBQ04_07775, partial [Candidatus Acidiferrales bacterium]